MTPQALNTLILHQQKFLLFLERRLGNRAAAEEVLQAAFLRGIERGDSLRDDENVVAWFYRLLRNAVGELYRRREVETRAVDHYGRELELHHDAELEATVCGCVTGMLSALKPEYAEIIRKVDLDGVAVPEAAAALGIKPNNAAVRLHRARRALGQAVEEACGVCCRNGCFDCECVDDLPPEQKSTTEL